MKLSKLLVALSLTSSMGLTACSSVSESVDLGSTSDSVKASRESIKSIKLFTRELNLLTKEIEELKKNNISKSSNSRKDSNNIYCEGNLKSSVTRIDKSIVPAGYNDLKDYQLTADFRRPGKKFPYSEALSYEDPVTGQSVAVRDQNFIPGGSKVYSSWGRYNIFLGGYWKFTEGGILKPAHVAWIPFEANILFIPDGDKFLIVKGCNGQFSVTKEVANALLKQDDSKNSYVRFSTEGTGSAHLSEVGIDTVKAWKKVYAKWQPAPKLKIENIGF